MTRASGHGLGLPRPANEEAQVERVAPVARIMVELARDTKPDSWLRAAEDRLVAFADDFTVELGVAAVKIAREAGRTAVDATDVDRAAGRRGRDAEVRASLVAAGGVATGGAVATAVAVLLSEHVHYEWAWWVFVGVLAIAGVACFLKGRPPPK